MSEGRPDFNGSNYDDAFLGDLVNFVAGNNFQSMFENYFLSHALFFTDDEEHKLEYMEYYQEFHSLFEEQLEDFCKEKGMSQSEFMARCSEASTEDVSFNFFLSTFIIYFLPYMILHHTVTNFTPFFYLLFSLQKQ